MAFHHRKLLKKFDSCSNPCVPNHGCSADCNHSPDDHSGSIHPIGHKPSILILTFCVLGAAFGIFCYLTIVKYYSNWINSRRRNSPTSDGDDIDTHEDFFDASLGPVLDHPIWYINTVGLQESIINSITIFNYKKDEGLIEGTECSVCLNEFQEDESLRLLPKCSHAFHIPCIDTWLRSHKNCPLCRAPIVCDSNHAQVGSSEPNLSDLGSTEETQVENLENFGGLGSLQVGESEMRVGPFPLSTEEETIDEILEKKSRARICKSRVLSDLGDHNLKVEEELQPRRRSVSMDSASASMIYLAMANIPPVENEGCSHTQLVQVKKPRTEMVAKRAKRNSSIYKLMKSSSIGRSLQKGPVSMKRSFSSSGKLSLPL